MVMGFFVISKMQIINDYFMMTVDQRYETTIRPDGIITLNSAWIHDESADRFAYKRIYGTIESCPENFTETRVEVIDPGFPNPRLFRSGEHIEEQIKKGYKHFNRKYYCCSTVDEVEDITLIDLAKNTDIRRFDKVYFAPTVTEPENLLGMHKKKELYKVRVDDILCVVRDGEILPQSWWCLVEPDMESWVDITTKAGIIMKPHPEAHYLRGTMRYFQHIDGLNEGDHIMYDRGADYLLKIEGKEYYLIQDRDILCKLEL